MWTIPECRRCTSRGDTKGSANASPSPTRRCSRSWSKTFGHSRCQDGRRRSFLFTNPDARLVPEELRDPRSEEHTSELQSRENLVCRLLLEKKKRRSTVT